MTVPAIGKSAFDAAIEEYEVNDDMDTDCANAAPPPNEDDNYMVSCYRNKLEFLFFGLPFLSLNFFPCLHHSSV
jgi:hypothetical protein